MLKEEFERMTGFYPSDEMYKVIEQEYMSLDISKDAFCRNYRKNEYGIASKIQRIADQEAVKASSENDDKLDYLTKKIANLEKELEIEHEWKEYQNPKMYSDTYYAQLRDATITRKMTSAEACEYISKTFGFKKDVIDICYTIPVYEQDRHFRIRNTGRLKTRDPLYASTDYNYILFACCGYMYECVDGKLYIVTE